MSRAVMQQALEALENMYAAGERLGWHVHPKWSTGMEKARAAIAKHQKGATT